MIMLRKGALFLACIFLGSIAPSNHLLKRQIASDENDAQEYLTELQDSKIRGIELILAGSAESLASRFGHVFIRFVAEEGSWTEDVVLSFGINLSSGVLMRG